MLCYREKREVRETRKEGGKTRLSAAVAQAAGRSRHDGCRSIAARADRESMSGLSRFEYDFEELVHTRAARILSGYYKMRLLYSPPSVDLMCESSLKDFQVQHEFQENGKNLFLPFVFIKV